MITPVKTKKGNIKFLSLYFIICILFFKDIQANEKEAELSVSSPSTPLVLIKEPTPYDFGESISFSSCGFHLPFHLGVAKYLQETYDLRRVRFLAASGGVFAAMILGMDLDFKTVWDACEPKLHQEARNRLTGVLFNFEEIAKKVFLEYWPENSFKKANGRVLVSTTAFHNKIFSFKVIPYNVIPYNKRISEWNSNADLADTVVATTKIPYFTEWSFFAYINGEKHSDGAITDHQPIIDQNTICVSPYLWGDFWRIGGLYPRFTEKSNAELIKQGYEIAASNSKYFARLERFRKVRPAA